jgi:hypothetical protein
VSTFNEERLGDLLSALPPAPKAWVEAAKEVPLVRRRLDQLVERARADEDFRRRVVADPEGALEEAEVIAHSENIKIIRKRLEGEK